MSTSIPRIFVKTGCPWCTEALDVLIKKGIQHQLINVSSDPEAYKEMVKLSGQSKAPTLDWNGEILSDFGADELLPFLKKRGL